MLGLKLSNMLVLKYLCLSLSNFFVRHLFIYIVCFRTHDATVALWESLPKTRSGEVVKRTGDYAVRKGLCHAPITIRELYPVTVCHKVNFSSLMVFSFYSFLS